jgi:hypothetical protein
VCRRRWTRELPGAERPESACFYTRLGGLSRRLAPTAPAPRSASPSAAGVTRDRRARGPIQRRPLGPPFHAAATAGKPADPPGWRHRSCRAASLRDGRAALDAWLGRADHPPGGTTAPGGATTVPSARPAEACESPRGPASARSRAAQFPVQVAQFPCQQRMLSIHQARPRLTATRGGAGCEICWEIATSRSTAAALWLGLRCA